MPNPMSIAAKPAAPLHLLPHELRIPDFGAEFADRNAFTILTFPAVFGVIGIKKAGNLLRYREQGDALFFDDENGWAHQIPGINWDALSAPARTQAHKMLRGAAYQADRLYWLTAYFEAACIDNRPANIDAMYREYRILPRCYYVRGFTAQFYNEILEKHGNIANNTLLSNTDFVPCTDDEGKDRILKDISSGKTLSLHNTEVIADNTKEFGLEGEIDFRRDHFNGLGTNNASLYEIIAVGNIQTRVGNSQTYVNRVQEAVERMHGVA